VLDTLPNNRFERSLAIGQRRKSDDLFPIIETLEGRSVGYIPTNVLSHDDRFTCNPDLFNAGVRPARGPGGRRYLVAAWVETLR